MYNPISTTIYYSHQKAISYKSGCLLTSLLPPRSFNNSPIASKMIPHLHLGVQRAKPLPESRGRASGAGSVEAQRPQRGSTLRTAYYLPARNSLVPRGASPHQQSLASIIVQLQLPMAVYSRSGQSGILDTLSYIPTRVLPFPC